MGLFQPADFKLPEAERERLQGVAGAFTCEKLKKELEAAKTNFDNTKLRGEAFEVTLNFFVSKMAWLVEVDRSGELPHEVRTIPRRAEDDKTVV